MSQKRLLIDTDVGGDIDDALAIAMALNEPTLDVVGLTNVYIDNTFRGKVTRGILSSHSRGDIPVLFGAEKPLCGAWGDASASDRNEAVDFIINAAREKPLIILALAPMTNLALAIQKAPDIAKSLTIYAMGGMISRAFPEWNILCDPEAAQIVMQSGADITLAGLDVTESCCLTQSQSEALVAGESEPLICLQGEMDRFHSLFDFQPILHDPLALLCLLEPDVCRYEEKEIQVERRGEFTRGVTVDVRFAKKPNARVAVAVDSRRAVDSICRRVRNDPEFNIFKQL